jgi:hypothetical protein
MKLISGLLAGLCGLGISVLLGTQTIAQEHASSSDEAGNGQLIRLAQEDSAAAADEDAKEEEAKEEEEAEESPRPRSAAPERFIPTEKISADSAVSFPVDI